MLITNSTTILIVEEKENDRGILRTFIEKEFEDIQVVETNSGLNALGLLLKYEVNFMFINVQMPHINGFETAKMIQKKPKTRDIPIIFMITAEKLDELQKTDFDIGSLDLLLKPIDQNQFMMKLQSYLKTSLQQQKETNEQNSQVTESFSDTNFSDIILDSEQIEYLNTELTSSINALLSYNKLIKQQAIDSGCTDLIDNLDKMNLEGQYLLDFVNKYLDPIGVRDFLNY